MRYQIKKIDYKNNDDYDRYSNLMIKIPINKIKDIGFLNIDRKESDDRDKKIKEGYRPMYFLTNSNNIIVYDEAKGTTTLLPAYIIPSFNIEEEEKLKKAILNLKTYYNETADPFE